jgi:hypothetical protein
MQALNHHYTVVNLNLKHKIKYTDFEAVKKITKNVWTLKECVETVIEMFEDDPRASVQILIDKTIVLHTIDSLHLDRNTTFTVCASIVNSLTSIVHSNDV